MLNKIGPNTKSYGVSCRKKTSSLQDPSKNQTVPLLGSTK